jgi:tripartite-type tricarboxylate transporter receptor subunit TctC
MFKAQTGTAAVHVPYRGAAPAMQDLLGGQLDFMFDPGIGLQHVRAGKLRLLAVGSAKRSPLFPDVPTLDESGLKSFDADTWFGFYAPAGTPSEVVLRLNREINRVLGTEAVKERISALGGIPAPMSPAEFNQSASSDSVRLGALIRSQDIKIECAKQRCTRCGVNSATAIQRGLSGFRISFVGLTRLHATFSYSVACRPGTRPSRVGG